MNGYSKSKNDCVTYSDVIRAQKVLRQWLSPTPLTSSPAFEELYKKGILLKWENRHRTGSFKERGAINFLSGLEPSGKARGVCAVSAGNHALALSYYASKFKIPCTIVMPRHAPLVKVQATRENGAHVVLHGEAFDDAKSHALELCETHGYRFASPFDNKQVIAGQGTCALEILKSTVKFDTIIVPIGGGGLISGIATVLREKMPRVKIIGVRSEWADYYAQGNQHRKGILPGTIAEGIAVKQIGELTGKIIKETVDDIVTVSEGAIASAIMRFLEKERAVVEGAGAASLAAVIANKLPKSAKNVLLLVCGSNIDLNVLSRLIGRDMREQGRLMRVTLSVPDRPGSLQKIAALIAESGANVLEVFHDRSYARSPGDVVITCLAELRDVAHKQALRRAIVKAGIAIL